MPGETVLNLFVSSPSDVQRERERIDLVVERLNAEYAGRARIRTVRWETRYYSSHDTFQAQIPEAAECDLVLAIFGARLGSPLPKTFPTMPSGDPYPSGTAYEVLTAIEARRRGRGTPDVYVFRRPSAPLVALDAADRAEVEAQWRRLTGFFETWFRNRGGQFIAAFQEFATTDEFAGKVEDCLRQWLVRRGFPAKAATWDRVKRGSPFPGLAAFDESRQTVFFGRSLVIDQAIRRLREVEAGAEHADRAPYLLLIGASGSGKSSLLRAGLMPRVGMPGVLPEVDLWRRAYMAPGLDPFLSLAESLLVPEALGVELARGPFRTREMLAKQLASDPDVAIAPLHEALEIAAEARRREEGFDAPRPARLFLAVDQAERLLIESPLDVQTRFSQLIAALCRRRTATVLVALRSDAYARFQALEALVSLRDAGATLDLLPATASELEEMATRPAALCEPPLMFERREGGSLASVLVSEARGGDALPLLQMTLARLSAAEAARGDGVLRFSDYHGLGEAVTQTANEVLAGLDEKARAELPQLIAGLVRNVATDPLTGKPTPMIGALDRSRFEAGHPERKALVEAFVAKRLLTAEGDVATQRVRPTHESLLRIWPEAVAIIADGAHLIRTREALEPIVREWAEAAKEDRARHLDISPALLDGATAFVQRFGEEASPATREFVAAAAAVAEARRERERREQERRLADAQAIAAANKRIARRTGIGLIAALALAALAGWQWHSASRAQQEAQAQRDRAERALAAATQTADTLVFNLAQKFRNVAGVPKTIIKDILDQARALQEQLLSSGESSVKLNANHAAALAELAITEVSLGDAPTALTLDRQALDIYEKILATAPDNVGYLHDDTYTQDHIGDILAQQGSFDAAQATYERARSMIDAAIDRGINDPRLRSDQALYAIDLGALARRRGDLPSALKLFRDGLAIEQALAVSTPDDIGSRHQLAIAHRNVGDVLLAQSDIDGSLAEFDTASAIALRLAQENPNDTLLQRDYSLSEERLGETLTAKKDYAGALKAYSDGEATAIAMAAGDPENLEWQYDISIGHIEVGDTQLQLGNYADALQSFREAIAIDRLLTQHDGTNVLWYTHRYNALLRLGDALFNHGEAAAALDVYREALAFSESISARDASEEEWARNVIWSEDKVGSALSATGDQDGALATYRGALDQARALPASKDASNDIFANLTLVAGGLTLKNDLAGALSAYAEAITLARSLIAQDPKATALRGKLATLLVSEGEIQRQAGNANEGIAELREAVDLSTELSAEQGSQPLWLIEGAIALDRLGDALRDKGDLPGALDAYRKSLAIDDGLPAASLPDPQLRTSVALTSEAAGAILERQKDFAGALAAMQKALTLRQGLADAAPDDAQKRRAQLIDVNAVGRLLNAAGDAQRALAVLRDGLAVARALAARPGVDETARNDLVISLSLVAMTASLTGDSADTIAASAEGIQLAEALAGSMPSNRGYKLDIWILGVVLGDARLATNDLSAARDAYVAARDAAAAQVALDSNGRDAAGNLKTSVAKIGLLADAMLLAGDFTGALVTLDKATPVAPDQNWLDLVRAACLMFLDRADEARAIYAEHRGETTYGGKTWEQAATEGFATLRAKGLTNPLMAEIEASFANPR